SMPPPFTGTRTRRSCASRLSRCSRTSRSKLDSERCSHRSVAAPSDPLSSGTTEHEPQGRGYSGWDLFGARGARLRRSKAALLPFVLVASLLRYRVLRVIGARYWTVCGTKRHPPPPAGSAGAEERAIGGEA